MKKGIAVFFVLFSFIIGSYEEAFSRDGYEVYPRFAADDLIINRPVNMQGLTGLLFTNSAYTQPASSVTFGLAGLAEDSSQPNYSIVQGMASLTIGLTDRVEAAVRGKMIATGLGSSTDREVGMGDTELLLKWRFSSQGEVAPAMAFGLAWTFPTGDNEKGFEEVKYESIKLMAIASGENRVLDEGFFGIYLEAQAVLNDQFHARSDSPYKEKYGVINAGILFPLSDDNHLQVLLEYTRVLKKDRVTLYEGNYTGLVPGLRYVTENFSLTAGIQQISREDAGPAVDSRGTRIAGAINYRF